MPPNTTPNVAPNVTPQPAMGPTGPMPPTPPPPLAMGPTGPMPPTPPPPQTPMIPPSPMFSANPSQHMQLNPAYTGNGIPIASLVLGIVSLPAAILSIFTIAIPIVGIVLGAIGFKKNKNFALAGIILSTIGIIASITLLVLGVHLYNKQHSTSTSSSSSSSATATTGNTISTACYKFDLPAPFSKSDVKINQDCKVELLNANGACDLVVNAVPVPQQIPANQMTAYLKQNVGDLESSLGSQFSETSNKSLTIGGQEAYQASGNESGTGTPYKFGYFMAAMSANTYTSSTGSKLQLFIFATDSVSQVSWLDHVASTWQWQ